MRGSDPEFYYNCYCQINGVEDKISYTNELYQLYQELKARKRNIVIVNGQIEPPTPEEIAKVSRKNYSKTDEMLLDLKRNLQYPANRELQSLMIKAFLDVLLEEEKALDENRNKLTNKAVYLICWMMRYLPELFKSWRMPQIGCFFYMGGCKNRFEALFLKMLGRLPVDVLILDPDRSAAFALEDQLLYQMNFTETLHLQRFPQENTEVRMGTAAYHAERELDTLMYQDSGLYRNQQYQRADIINLQTMYEEIRLLWNEEVKYRPNFSTTESTVNIPVIFAKVSGVKDGKVSEYWSSIRELITEDTMVIKSFPYIQPLAANPIKPYVTEFYKNGRLQKAKIKNHPAYAYGFLREEIQEHILNKLQILIEQKLIRGTFENGTEYTILSTILNLPKEILRMLQKFDFTKKNKRSGKVENVGYLDLEQDEEQSRCSLYFYGDIVSATWESMWYEEDRCPQDIADFLNQLDGYEDIDIYFNSGGGDVFAGLAIYNQLKRYSGHKVGYVDGMAASIASVIMFACDELHFATGAQAMIHKPLCMAWGNADDFKEVIKQLDLCEDSILDVYEEHMKEGVTRDKIKSFMAKEKWFSGAELAEYFDVEIDDKAAVAACASDYFEKYSHVPENIKGTDTKDIVNAVLAELENRNNAAAEAEKQRIEAEKQDILADLDMYGI